MFVNNILVFEDDRFKDFHPLSYLRPTYDLVCGMATLLAKITRAFPQANISLHCRDYLKNATKQYHPGIAVNNVNSGLGCLLINGRLLPPADLEAVLALDGKNRIFITADDEVVAAYFTGDHLNKFKNLIEKPISSKEFISTFRYKSEVREVSELPLIQDIGDLISKSAEQITFDFNSLKEGGLVKGDVHYQASILEEHKVSIGQHSRIHPQVVLDARLGPIHIGDSVEILGPSYIEGPAYIGNYSTVSSATLVGGCSIGPGCTVTGHLDNVVLHGFSTKRSAEYLGNLYSGEWTEFGIGTMSNPYVDPFAALSAGSTPTKKGFAVLGDFSRTGFFTRLSEGTVMGICSHISGGDPTVPKEIPSFVIGTEARVKEINEDDAITLITAQMKEKNIEYTFVERELLKDVYRRTYSERRRH